MADEWTLAFENLKNLKGDELLREVAKQTIHVRAKLSDIYHKLVQMDAKLDRA